MEEMPDWRPLMVDSWPGREGVSAGDKGNLLYTQHTSVVEWCVGVDGEGREEKKHNNSFIQKKASVNGS